MKPDKQEKEYPNVLVLKVWEKIPTNDYNNVINENGSQSVTKVFHHHLVTKEVSDYIRKLENKIKELESK